MSHISRIQANASNGKLNPEEIKRYSRHLIMPEVTMEGQKKIKEARVLVIGTGGLGSPLLAYIAAAGVGRIGLVDFDVVDYSNLQRQIIHSSANIGKPKVLSAKERILDINPFAQVDIHETALNASNALSIFEPYDIVVDGTDNFPTRYLVNDACALLDKPNVYGSIFRFEGQASVFWASHGPCYRCLYPEPPPPGSVPSCAEGGVLGILPGIIGVVQAIETIKLILGIGDSLIGRLLLFDALKMKFREMKLRKDPKCPLCGENRTIHKLIDYEQFCGMPARESSVTPVVAAASGMGNPDEIIAPQLKKKMDAKETFILLDVREPHEYEVAQITGSQLIPLGQLEKRINELQKDADIVIHCKAGVRGDKALKILRQHGFQKLTNLKGGILAWSREVDPNVPEY